MEGTDPPSAAGPKAPQACSLRVRLTSTSRVTQGLLFAAP